MQEHPHKDGFFIEEDQGEWATQCTILDKSTPKGKAVHNGIEPILRKHNFFFDDIPLGLPRK